MVKDYLNISNNHIVHNKNYSHIHHDKFGHIVVNNNLMGNMLAVVNNIHKRVNMFSYAQDPNKNYIELFNVQYFHSALVEDSEENKLDLKSFHRSLLIYFSSQFSLLL